MRKNKPTLKEKRDIRIDTKGEPKVKKRHTKQK